MLGDLVSAPRGSPLKATPSGSATDPHRRSDQHPPTDGRAPPGRTDHNRAPDLKEPAQARDWEFLYQRLTNRITYHSKKAERRNYRYKRLASLFHIAIPLLSVAVTIVTGSQLSQAIEIAFVLSAVLTVISTLDATLEPGRRFREEVDCCIELHDLQFEMDTGVEHLKHTGKRSTDFLTYLEGINRKISRIGIKMAGLPLPKTPRHIGKRNHEA